MTAESRTPAAGSGSGPTAGSESYGRGPLGSLFRLLERVGNRVPEPFTLFVYAFCLLAVLSTVFAGRTVTVPGQADAVIVRNFLSVDGALHLLDTAVENFIGFPALGTVLVMVMAVGVAQGTGLLEAAVRAMMVRVPAWAIPYAVAFAAAQGHVLSDASYFVIAPLGALVFKACGRNPLAGLIGSYACLQAGYAGGFVLGTLDATYAGITQEAAMIVGGDEPIHIAMNIFYTAAAGIILPVLGGWLIAHVLEPRLPASTRPPGHDDETTVTLGVTPVERRGLLMAIAGVATYSAVALTLWLLPDSPLRGDGGRLVPSPFTSGLVPLIAIAFVIGGAVYGFVTRAPGDRENLPTLMARSVRNVAGLVVLFFVVGQVFALIQWTNLGTFLAVTLAETARAWHIEGFAALMVLVVVSALLNMVITSGSGLWSLVGPVMVPSIMLLGLSPAAIQAAHRIGDSTTSLITPMSVFLFWLLGVAREYEPGLKFGTLITRLAVFVPVYLVGWIAVLAAFYYADLPLGPGTGFELTPP
ncbi:AbgT family transporter [Pseudonocardia sp. C8]|uniref:AbgT family transporter n=1 Tax=Pseudonocardia sp. C8 TaxID=2762759 RepID=UPI001642B9FE|nr:AbgT family transporter [Pseudonocardia sp. C8]MBC3192281.1 AbgT family transporter [Pseudonocardia sp. C8]